VTQVTAALYSKSKSLREEALYLRSYTVHFRTVYEAV